MTMFEQSQQKKFTYRDYVSWPPAERWEIIDGVARPPEVVMQAKERRVLESLYSRLQTYFLGHPDKVVGEQVEVCLPIGGSSAEDSVNVVRADMAVFDKVLLEGECCEGVPLLIAEMVSPASFIRDAQEKYQLYEQALVPEYWLIETQQERVTVFHLRQDGRYGAADTFKKGDEVWVGCTADLTIALSDIFGE